MAERVSLTFGFIEYNKILKPPYINRLQNSPKIKTSQNIFPYRILGKKLCVDFEVTLGRKKS